MTIKKITIEKRAGETASDKLIPSYKEELKPDLDMKFLLKASSIFLRTALVNLHRKLPERPTELGGKRKVLDLNVFVMETWLSVTSKKDLNPKSYGIMEAFSKYITRIDDLLDTDTHPSIFYWNTKYKTDAYAREVISIFVERVLDMKKENFLTRYQVKEIIKSTAQYRRNSCIAIESYELLKDPKLSEILKIKEETTGGMGAILAKILCISENVEDKKQEAITHAFSNSFMATQVADDMHDIKEDIINNTPNIAVVILKKYPEEYNALIQHKSTSASSYKKLAPKTYSELMEICNQYLSFIPTTPESIRLLNAIPQLFHKLTALTSR